MSQLSDSSFKLSKPFSSDTDEEMQHLMDDATFYRSKLEGQWGDLKSGAKEYGKHALIIGGIVTATFLVMNALLPDAEEELEEEIEPVSQKIKEKVKTENTVVNAAKSLVWTLAIGWAQQKLKNFIANDDNGNEDSEA